MYRQCQRRAFFTAVSSGILLCLATTAAAAGAPIRIFYPSVVSVPDRQKAARADALLSSHDPIVFKKNKEFVRGVKDARPVFAIAPGHFADFNESYKPIYQFSLDGKESYVYALVSADQAWGLGRVGSGKIGVFDEFGRKGMKKYLRKFLDLKPKGIKRLVDLKDLFHILALENANYVLVPKPFLEKTRGAFELDVNVLHTTEPVPLPRLFVRKDYDGKVPNFAKISKATVAALGFSGINPIN